MVYKVLTNPSTNKATGVMYIDRVTREVKDYIRGFGFQGGGSTSFRLNAPGYGQAFKKAVLDPLTSVNLVGFGEVLPRHDNFVALDPTVVDMFGIPVLRITMSWGENEKKMIPTWQSPQRRCSRPRARRTFSRSPCSDPAEIRNLAGQPAHASQQMKMRQQLDALRQRAR